MFQILQGLNNHILWGNGWMGDILVLEKHGVCQYFCFDFCYPDVVSPIIFIACPNVIPISLMLHPQLILCSFTYNCTLHTSGDSVMAFYSKSPCEYVCAGTFGATWYGLTKFKVRTLCGSNLYHRYIGSFGCTPDKIAMRLFLNI